MVSQGAGCVCLTSRNPTIDPGWLASFQSTSSTVRIFPMDVTDMETINSVIKTIRNTCPPIVGVVHGAMVLSDALFANMSFDQMQVVLAPKIDGANNLNQAFYDDDLDFFILLASGAGVVGNSGQSNYAVTSGYLNSLARQRRRRGLAASTIDIGMVTGIGYIETAGQHVVGQLGKYGVSILSEPDFRLVFAEAVQAGYPNPEDKVNIPDAVVTTGIRTISEGETNVIWRNNPIFSHCVITEAKDSGDGVAGQSSSRAVAIPVMEQISQASSKEAALEVIQGEVPRPLSRIDDCHADKYFTESFLSKLWVILQNAELELDHSAPLVEVGIDSLVAVEVRSWFLKELKVDVPVLKIVGGASLVDLCNFAINKLPNDLITITEKSNAVSQNAAPSLSKRQSPVPPELSASDASSQFHVESGSTSTSEMTPSLSVTGPSSKSQSKGSEVSDSQPNTAPRCFPESALKPVVPRTIVRRAELTPGQLGHLRLIKLLQDSVHLNIACLIKVEGILKTDKLAEAAHIVSRRHEALRTCFISEESTGTTVQAVFAESGILVDEGLVKDEAAAQKEYARLEKHEFELENGDCMRISILESSRNVHFVIIVWSHLVMDGASFEVFWADLMQVYNGSALLTPPPQYAVYAEKQRENIQNGLLSEQVSFWQQKLCPILDQGPLPLLPFANVRTRQTLAPYCFHSARRANGISMTKLIHSTCQRLKTNAFQFYLAVFKILLTKLLEIGDKELCIGE
jgi:hybrid polyketide synthase/nonribosomal peptide synthetase ACE1